MRERGEGKEEGRISSSPYEEREDACSCGKERNKNMRKMREGEKGERKGKREREVVVRERERGGWRKLFSSPLHAHVLVGNRGRCADPLLAPETIFLQEA